jgi:hypothetical protein
MVIFLFGPCQDSWPYFCSFQDNIYVLKWGLLFDKRRDVTIIVNYRWPLTTLLGSGKLLLDLVSTIILGSGSHRSHDHIFLPHDFGSRAAIPDKSVCLENCVWPFPAQSFFISGPTVLMTHISLWQLLSIWCTLRNFRSESAENITSNSSSIVVCIFVAERTCIHSRCLAIDVSTALPWLHYSGFHASYHIALSLRLFIPSSLQVHHHLFCYKGAWLWRLWSLSAMTPQCHADLDASPSTLDGVQPPFFADPVTHYCSPTAHF